MTTGLLVMLPAAVVQAALPPLACWVLLTVILVISLGCDARILPWRLPQNARLVPSDIIVRTGGSGALQFGFEMGTGMRTFLPSHLPYLALGVALLVCPWWAAPLVGLSFGFGRTVMVRSAVASGSASSWDTAFNARRSVIYPVCWISALTCLALLVSRVMPLA
jgi:hypothetical protein